MPERPQVNAVLPRRFALIRHVDYTGVSGIGVVAYGVVFADGQTVLRWCSDHPATSLWNSMDDLLAVHGHGEATSVQWLDAARADLEALAQQPLTERIRRPSVPAPGVDAEPDGGNEPRDSHEQNGHGGLGMPGLLEPLADLEGGDGPQEGRKPEGPRRPGRHRRADSAETRR